MERVSGAEHSLASPAEHSSPLVSGLVRALPDPAVLTHGPDHVVAAFNGPAESLLGPGRLLHGASLLQALEAAAADASAVRTTLPDADEAVVPLRLASAGEAVPVLWQAQRVSAQAEDSYLHRFLPAQSAAEEPARLEFLANVTHELRTPLSAMVATTEFMLQDYQSVDPLDLGQMIALLHRNTRRLEALVSNLLDAAALQAGRFQLRRSTATVASLVQDAADFVQPLIDNKNQRLDVRLMGSQPALVVDSKRVVGVLVNLLSNASRYGPPNEAVQLIVSTEGTLVRFTVRQKGPGIPKNEQARLFQRYYRASTSEHVAGGSGLGLAIVKDIVEMHGGSVGVVSRHNGGTAFWFTLPISAQQEYRRA